MAEQEEVVCVRMGLFTDTNKGRYYPPKLESDYMKEVCIGYLMHFNRETTAAEYTKKRFLSPT